MTEMKAGFCQFVLHEVPNFALHFSSAQICTLYRVVRLLTDSWLSPSRMVYCHTSCPEWEGGDLRSAVKHALARLNARFVKSTTSRKAGLESGCALKSRCGVGREAWSSFLQDYATRKDTCVKARAGRQRTLWGGLPLPDVREYLVTEQEHSLFTGLADAAQSNYTKRERRAFLR